MARGDGPSARDLLQMAIARVGVETLFSELLGPIHHESGDELTYICPDTGKPKLNVNRDTGYWRSLTAGTEGDYYTLRMKMYCEPFGACVHFLSDVVGIQLNGSAPTEDVWRRQTKLTSIFEEIHKYAIEELNDNHLGRVAKSYLQARGYTPEQLTQMELGSISNTPRLLRRLLDKGFSEEDIKLTAIDRDSRIGSELYPIAIPWRDISGRILSFSFRTTQDLDPKYLYLAGFKKSEHILGIHNCRRQSRVVLVEGGLDALLLGTYSIPAGALGGNSLSKAQAQLLQRAGCEWAVLALDNDPAGRDGVKGRERVEIRGAIRTLRDTGFVVTVWPETASKDPEELVFDYGIDAFARTIDESISWAAWLGKEEVRDKDLLNPGQRDVALMRASQRYKMLRESDPLAAGDYLDALVAACTVLDPDAVRGKVRGAVDASYEKLLTLRSSVLPITKTVVKSLDEIRHRLKFGYDSEERFETGFKWLNEQMRGYQRGDFVILQAGFGHGKSVVSLYKAAKQVLAGHRVGYIGLDMNEPQLADYAGVIMHNIVSPRHQHIQWSDITWGDGGDMHLMRMDSLQNVIQQHFEQSFFEFRGDTLTLNDYKEVTREMVRQGCDIIYLDYMELIKEYQDAIGTGKHDSLLPLVVDIKNHGRDLKYTNIVQQQVAREGMKQGNPHGRSGAGSDHIGRQAHFLMSVFDIEKWMCEEAGCHGFTIDPESAMPRKRQKEDTNAYSEPLPQRPMSLRLVKSRRGGTGKHTFWFDFTRRVVVDAPRPQVQGGFDGFREDD